jgi:Zn-dependent protease
MNTILIAMTFVSFILTVGIRYGTQALVTTLLGDGSPAKERRLSPNPMRHLAALGTSVAFALSFPIGASVPAGLGWGKPIEPDAARLSIGAKAGTILIALSGIVTNFIIGIVIAVALGFVPFTSADARHIYACGNLAGGPLQSCLSVWQPGWALRLEQFGFIFASVNILVGLLNIIPLYPLDGYFILYELLPARMVIGYRNSQMYQEMILFGVLLFLPFVLLLAGLPPTFAPSYLLQTLSLKIMSLFTYFEPFAEAL